MQLARQASVYRNCVQEELCGDTLQCIHRYMHRVFTQVKFFSDDKADFDKPCFVSDEGKTKQTVGICNFLLKNIRKERYSEEDKAKFWVRYRRHVKSGLNKLRQTATNGFSSTFKKGT